MSRLGAPSEDELGGQADAVGMSDQRVGGVTR